MTSWPAQRENIKRLLGFLAAMAVPLALLAVGQLLINQTKRATVLRGEVEISYARRLLLEHILSLHQDIETSSRGYALVGRDEFLEPYRAASPQIGPALAALDKMDGETIATSRLATLRQLSQKKRFFADETVELYSSGNTAKALARIRSGDGKIVMDAIRREIARLQQLEARRLNTLSRNSEAANQRLQLMAFAILSLLLLLLATAAALIFRTIRSRAQALAIADDLSRRRKAVLDAAMDGIFILNPSGSIESVNQAGMRMFGYTEEELLRRDVGMLFANPPPIGQVASSLRQMQLREDEPGALHEIPGRGKDGSIITADVGISAVALSDGIHYVAMVRDMSERKKVERMKAEFVASVSHELRTPLTSIAGSLGLLGGGAAGPLPERAEKLVGIARNNADRLVRLINDILDIEKIDSGRMTFNNATLRLSDLAAQAIEANRPYAERLGVHLVLAGEQGDAFVWADPDRLMQILANLLSNAAKFSPKGETVELRITPGARQHRISISDRGPGISAEFARRIFNRFAQADSTDARQKDGTGLGLAIVREIIQRLGGAVSYDSTPGQGATFHVDLPAARHEPLGDAHDRLLLCEHDQQIANTLALALSRTGLHCDIVTSASDAVRATARSSYRVILVDSALPTGGISLVRSLREKIPAADTPILMISAEDDSGVIGVDALQVAEWLPKPVSLDKVVAAVSRVIGQIASERQPRVLHIEDDPDIVRLVETALEGRAVLTSAATVGLARKLIAQEGADLAILDLGLTDGSGVELLPDLATAPGGPIPVIIFSAQDADPEVATRVQAYLTKSHTPIERLVHTVIRLTGAREATGEIAKETESPR